MEKIGACVLEALDALASKRKIAFAQIRALRIKIPAAAVTTPQAKLCHHC
jgi:hypothetical protein